ncbi:unnamed protein product [Strongylus vulgaris]|uniref:Uncharacterized protein n=1 Tax=Strongylus vulgaris TaxID=40348 RepID=A0A3P7IEI7_STRVU|nr:unnamed protein product [Strongylus vulgaris]
MGHYELVHEAAHAVEKIICAANTGETELMSMWYDELVEEYLAEQPVGIELFPFSSLEFQLKIATAFVVLQQEAFDEQLRLMETLKYLMDRRLKARHGSIIKDFQLLLPSYQKSFVYIFKVGRIELYWFWDPNEGEELNNAVEVQDENLTFFENCLAQYLEKRGVHKLNSLSKKAGVVIANDTVHDSANTTIYALYSSNQHAGILWFPLHSQAPFESSVNLYNKIRELRHAFIAVVDSADCWLNSDVSLSIGRTPPIVISRGPLEFDTIRSLFLCGTDVVVELDVTSSIKEAERLVDEICQASDIAMVLPRYKCTLRSADCLLWTAPPTPRMSLDTLKTHAGNIKNNTEMDLTTGQISNKVPTFLLETRHLSNFWLNRTRRRNSNGSEDNALTETTEFLMRTLLKVTTFPTKQEQHDFRDKKQGTRKKRRRKKMENLVARGYMSDSGETSCHHPIHSRSLSDLHT